jgi:hypothetical protein
MFHWRKFTTNQRIQIAALIVPVLIAGGSWYFSSTREASRVSENQGPTQVAEGNSAPVTQSITVNQVANYRWMNADTWSSGTFSDTYGKGNYRTDLIFTADSPILPHQVCPQLNSDVQILDIFNSGISTIYNGCLQNPSALTLTIQLVTRGKPTWIHATLINK